MKESPIFSHCGNEFIFIISLIIIDNIRRTVSRNSSGCCVPHIAGLWSPRVPVILFTMLKCYGTLQQAHILRGTRKMVNEQGSVGNRNSTRKHYNATEVSLGFSTIP